MYWFSSDQHFFHRNIVKYSNRPFNDVEEMNETLINNHNEVVDKNDIVIHAGDFSFAKKTKTYNKIVSRLNGNNIFLKGDHDRWLGNSGSYAWKKTIEGIPVFVCHYAMRTWWLSHYNSWNLFGHSHGRLEGIGKQIDVGVDMHNYYPVSFDRLKVIMDTKDDNFNYIGNRKGE